MLSDAEEELERENVRLRADLIRERRARELRAEVNSLAARTSAEVSRTGVAQVIADGASALFSAGWVMVGFISDEASVEIVHGPGVPPAVAADWSEADLETSVPICDVLRGDLDRVELRSVDDFTPWPIMVDEAERASMKSLVVRRIGVGELPSAVVAIAWPEPHTLDSVDFELLDLLVEQAGPGFDRSAKTEVDGDLARAVQTLLLESELPTIDGLSIATLYEAGRDFLAVGGDWYDVVPLDTGRTAIVIGDVVGHDVRAAVEMSQVRHVLAAHLVALREPVEALDMTDAYLRQRSKHVMATALIVIIEGDGTLSLASAGHIAPLALRPGEPTRIIPCGLGPPLGSGLGGYTCTTAEMADDTVLVCFTDGVIEQRSEPVDESLETLRTELDGLVASRNAFDGIAQEVVEMLRARVDVTWRTDDAAAVVVHFSAD